MAERDGTGPSRPVVDARMDLGLFSRLMLRRGWLVVAGAAVGAVVGLAVVAASTPVYGAVTRVKVQPARPADLGQTQAIREIMNSYMRDIRTYDMAAAVRTRICGAEDPLSQDVCQRWDAGGLRSMIEVGADLNVFEIRIKARATDPAVAVKVSEQTAHAFVDRREKANRELLLSDRILVGIREAPQPAQDAPRRKLIVAALAAAGAALGGVLALGWEYLDRTVVRDATDVERLLGRSVLAAIPDRGGRGGRRGPAWREPARLLARGGRLLVPVLLLAGLGGAAALAFSRAQPTLYVARARIAVEPARGSDWGQSLAIREITRGFGEDIRTREMAAAVGERLQLDLPGDVLLEKVHVAPEVEVYEIVIEAFDPDPEAAERIATVWAEMFVEERRAANLELDQSDRILTRLRDRAETELWSPKTMSNVLAGALIGAMVGAAAVYALHALRARVVTGREDAARATGAPVLGTVPTGSARSDPGGAPT